MVLKNARYRQDKDFTTICKDGCVYTLEKATGFRGCIRVGEPTFRIGTYTYLGAILSVDDYAEIYSACDKIGTFEFD